MSVEEIAWGYGFWSAVVVNAAIVVSLALFSLTPAGRREWRSSGGGGRRRRLPGVQGLRAVCLPRLEALRRSGEPAWSER